MESNKLDNDVFQALVCFNNAIRQISEKEGPVYQYFEKLRAGQKPNKALIMLDCGLKTQEEKIKLFKELKAVDCLFSLIQAIK